jgi:hypothetical protein
VDPSRAATARSSSPKASQPTDSTDIGTLDLTVVSQASDWPDKVIFDSIHPPEVLPTHLHLSLMNGVPLLPIDSLLPTISARRTLPPGLTSKHVKRNLPFGSPMKGTKSEGGHVHDMDSSEGNNTWEEAQKGEFPPVGQAYVQFLMDQLQQPHMDVESKEQATINAFKTMMARVVLLE